MTGARHIAADAQREFAFSDADFRALVRIAYDRTGISLADGKRNLVYGRVSRRLRALRLPSFQAYRRLLEADTDNEVERFINSIATNHTRFFREPHHFAHFAAQLCGPAGSATSPRRLRIWSAGCSSGEEAYTIALILDATIPARARGNVRVLATDIDTDVLARATRATYPLDALAPVPDRYAGRWQAAPRNPKAATLDDPVRALVSFARLNLIAPWPCRGPFDAIFCRNVMIYFDQPTRAGLVERFTDLLRPGGWLYIGHSESLIGGHPRLKLEGRTIYRRIA